MQHLRRLLLRVCADHRTGGHELLPLLLERLRQLVLVEEVVITVEEGVELETLPLEGSPINMPGENENGDLSGCRSESERRGEGGERVRGVVREG